MKRVFKHLAKLVFNLLLIAPLAWCIVHASDLPNACHVWLTNTNFSQLITYVGLTVLALLVIYFCLCSWLSPAAFKELLNDPGAFSMAVVGLAATAVFGWLSYQTSRQATQMTLRNELYANERWWYDACAENPHLYAWVAQVKPDTTPPEYVRLCLEATSKGLKFSPKNVHELKSYLWDADQFHNDGDHQARLRRQYDVMDLVFYHLERVHSYTSSEFRPMSEDEANSWLGLLENVGPNPLLLVSILDAYEYGYISPDFAAWVQRTFRKHEHAAVVAYFYPHLLEDSWLRHIESIHAGKTLYNPAVHEQWAKQIEERMAKASLPWKRPGRENVSPSSIPPPALPVPSPATVPLVPQQLNVPSPQQRTPPKVSPVEPKPASESR